MKTLNSLLTGLLMVPMFVGCVGSSDALKDYKNVKGVAPTGEKPKEQNVLSTDPEKYFSLNVIGPDEVNFVNLEQGKPAEIRFKVTVNDPAIKAFDVQMGEFPQADAPTLQKNSDGTYSLKWTPQMGTVTNGDSKQFKVPIQVFATEPKATDLSKLMNTINVILEVKGNAVQPTILSRSEVKEIEEGIPTRMEVIVEDPGATSNKIAAPEIVITSFPYTNKEAYRADGRPYVFQDSVEKISDTKFKFNLILFAQSLPLDKNREGHDDPTSQSVLVCFYMRALGVTERMSGAKEVCIPGKYSVQAPVINYAKETPSEVKAGAESTINFTVSDSNNETEVSMVAPIKETGVLTGTHSIDCSYQNPNSKNGMNCMIKWKPACVTKAFKLPFVITAKSKLHGKERTTTFTKEFTVMPNAEACAAGGR